MSRFSNFEHDLPDCGSRNAMICDAGRHGIRAETTISNSRPAPGGKRTVYLDNVGIWHNEETDHIHIGLGPGDGEISTVSPDAASKRGNPHLWGKLRDILEEHGRFP